MSNDGYLKGNEGMQAYTGFAQVYDLFMDNIPYDEWSEYLVSMLKQYGTSEGLVLELGCGTGKITRRLADLGYDMIGIDNSYDMLSIAIEQEDELRDDEGNLPRNGILYLHQDMREFELYGTVAAVVSICDSMNYITKDEDLVQVFRLVNKYLDTKGLFIFDLNTEYKYKEILGERIIAENREEASFIWDNMYYEDEQINEYNLTVYARVEDENEACDGLFERFDEVHYQKAYSLERIKELLAEAGMEFVTAYDAFTNEAPKADSERIYVVAREKRQADKFYTE